MRQNFKLLYYYLWPAGTSWGIPSWQSSGLRHNWPRGGSQWHWRRLPPAPGSRRRRWPGPPFWGCVVQDSKSSDPRTAASCFSAHRTVSTSRLFRTDLAFCFVLVGSDYAFLSFLGRRLMILMRRLWSLHGSDVGVPWRLGESASPSCGFQFEPKMRIAQMWCLWMYDCCSTVAVLNLGRTRAFRLLIRTPKQHLVSFSASALHTQQSLLQWYVGVRPTFWAFLEHAACKVLAAAAGCDQVFQN